MQNGDIKNFRCRTRARPATACCCRRWPISSASRSPSTPTPRSQAELAPKFSYGCAVFLDTDRVNFQKEGFAKEELLAGLAQVLPKNVWQYVVQIPRLAELGQALRAAGRHAVQPRRGQGAGRLHQGARAGGRGVRAPAHRRGRRDRRGVRDAARRQAPRQAPRPSSARCGDRARIHVEERRETVCHFCPNECKRTFIDTKTPDGKHRRYIAGFSCEKGTVESEGGDARARQGAQEDRQAVPEPGRLRGQARVPHFYEPRRCPSTAAGRRRRGRRRAASASVAWRSSARSSAARARRAALRRTSHRHPARAQHLLDGAVLAHLLRGARHPEAERRLQRRDDRGDVGRGRQVRLGRPVLPERRSCQAHIHNLLFHQHTRRSRSTTSSSRSSRTCRTSSRTMDNASCPIVAGVPDVMKAAFTKEVDFFAQRGIEYLDPRSRFERADADCKRRCSRPGARARHHRGRERLRDRRGVQGARSLRGRDLREGPRDPRDRRAREPRRDPHARPARTTRSGPQPRHPGGVPGARLPDPERALDPARQGVPRHVLRGRARAPGHQDPARHQRRVAGELLGQLGAEGVGGEVRRAPPERRVPRSVELQVRPRRADLRPHRQHHRDGAQRRTRRCTTSTRTSRRVDQDPREDLRPHAEALRESARGRRQKKTSSSSRSTRSASSSCELKLAQLADRKQTDDKLEQQIAAFARAPARSRRRRTKPEQPRELVPEEEDARRARNVGKKRKTMSRRPNPREEDLPITARSPVPRSPPRASPDADREGARALRAGRARSASACARSGALGRRHAARVHDEERSAITRRCSSAA
jgi:hypothetical protein